jgi:GH35 family endo-1,4-beta-xylanase
LLEHSADGEQFRKIVENHFSMVVFENDLKDYGWNQNLDDAKKRQRNEQLDRGLRWLHDRHIAVRGHYLMQTARPHNLQGKDAASVRRHFLDSARERLGFVGDRVCEWDVINHPIAWAGADLLTRHAGLERIDREVFDLARRETTLPLFINEDQIFRPSAQSDDTFIYFQSLKKEGYPVAGLGNQAHFDESYLPSPQEMLATTDRFATVVPRQIITEFDIVTTADESLAADFTRDIMIATFSHPAYHGFLLWGFWEGSHWKPQAASWNRDWSMRARGEAFVDLVGRQWHTKVTLTTDENGKVSWRGFPGWYKVTVVGSDQWLEIK